jgi:putative thioredoxin
MSRGAIATHARNIEGCERAHKLHAAHILHCLPIATILRIYRNFPNRTMTAASHVFDATEANFETDVIQASLTTPVLVDFWAAWCAPCKALGPILETVVADYNGAVKLAKVDTDAQGQLAAVFGIRSLPTVVLVKDGQMIDGFMGALPESAVREFLQRHNIVANAANAAIDTPAAAAEPTALETPEQTIARLQQEIAAAPDKSELKLDLATAYLRAGLADAALTELDSLPANLAEDAKAKRLRNQLEFARALKEAPDIATLRSRLAQDANDHAARDLLGVHLLLNGDTAAALEEFLHILQTQRSWNEGQAKKRLIAAFNILDDEDLVGIYRRKMASLLF